MSSARQEQQQSKVPSKFEKYSKIGDPEGIVYIVRCLMNGTTSTQSLKTLAQSGIGKKAMEIELSLLLLSCMDLLSLDNDTIAYSERLSSYYNQDKEQLCDWFVDEFIEYVMANDIIDIETISYEIGSDAYLMSPSSIKQKYAGFRNMLVDFGIIALRADAKYTILQKLDKYIARPEVRRKVTEKQLFAQLQKKKELGNTGEEWVLGYEKRRITNPDIQERIKRISLIDVGAGFDIVSYNDNDSKEFDRFIEVKTYKGNKHFHWSHNEIEKASLMGEQYYIYLVDADCIELEDYEPQIIQDPIKRVGESEGWAKRPDSYLVERVVEAQDGHILPLFTNVDESMPVRKPFSSIPNTSNIEFTTPETKFTTGIIKPIVDVIKSTFSNNNPTPTPPEDTIFEANYDSQEEILRKCNRIFILKTLEGKEISLYKLKLFIDKTFIPYIEHQYFWCAPWQFLKEKGLLVHGKRDCGSFADQMICDEWFGTINQDKCSKEGMRQYSCIDNYSKDNWNKILEKGQSKKINQDGINKLIKLYDRMDSNFQVGKILK